MNNQDQLEHSILVGIDFSPGSERALTMAVDLALRLAASLHVVHVFAPLDAIGTGPHRYVDVEAHIEKERLLQRDLCNKLCERVVGMRVPYTVHIPDAMPLDGLMEAIAKFKPVLVVVGSHGRGAFKRLLLGSVSTALCQHSPVPVVVVPPTKQAATATL